MYYNMRSYDITLYSVTSPGPLRTRGDPARFFGPPATSAGGESWFGTCVGGGFVGGGFKILDFA